MGTGRVHCRFTPPSVAKEEHVSIDQSPLVALADAVSGAVLTEDAGDYDAVRAVWNGAFDHRPTVIVRCLTTADVASAVTFAAEQHLKVAVRGGGHSLAGLSSCDDGVMIDLSLMRDIVVDVESRRARVQPGVLGQEMDRATQAHGLGTTLGTVSHTGIAGLTLGGGYGWAMRKHGLACDNVTAFEAVLADGQVVRASQGENPDLFWALRGGGGQLAVVTSFEYALHEFGPTISLAQFIFSPRDGLAATKLARDLAAGTSNERNMWLAFMYMPPDPDMPEDVRGKFVCLIMAVSLNPKDNDSHWLDPLLDAGPLLVERRTCDYVELQTMFDEDNAYGTGAYSKGAFFASLSDEALEAFSRVAQNVVGEPLVYLQQVGGAVAEVGEEDTAVGWRSAEYVLNVIQRWTDPAQAETCRSWARQFVASMQPFGLGGQPLNFAGEAATEMPVTDDVVFGGAIDRLTAVKRQVDPGGVFGSLGG